MIEMPPNIDVIRHPETAYCMVSAAHRFNLPVESLLALAIVESGRPGTESINRNGTHDLGVMQVNTLWLESRSPLRDYTTRTALTHDVCANIHAAAWILATHIQRVGGDIWRAIGMYHHPSDEARAQGYRLKANRSLPLARQILGEVPIYQHYINLFFSPPSAMLKP